jgi:hypothetical protein
MIISSLSTKMGDNYVIGAFKVLSATCCSNLNADNSYSIMYKIEIIKPPDRESKFYTAKGL